MLKNNKVVLFLSPNKFGQAGNFWTLLRIHVSISVDICNRGKWAKLILWPMTSYHQFLRNLSTRKQHVFMYLEGLPVASLGLCQSHLLCFPQRPYSVCKASSVTCNFTYFSGLFFNNFMRVYAYRNFTNSLREGKAYFSVLLCTFTNFRKP